MKNSCLSSPLYMIKAGFVVLLVMVMSETHGQSLNPNWNTELKGSLQEFMGCSDGPQVCSKFLGKSLNTVYKVNDFILQNPVVT